jgi:dihydrodipicolinate synthase/N-acetylneuraminate lyase
LRPDRYPTAAFCSLRCLNAGAAITKRNHGMIDKSALETKAIKAARRNFAEALVELGLMASFHDRSADEIDRIIEACIDGFQDAMRREALNDDIPF